MLRKFINTGPSKDLGDDVLVEMIDENGDSHNIEQIEIEVGVKSYDSDDVEGNKTYIYFRV